MSKNRYKLGRLISLQIGVNYRLQAREGMGAPREIYMVGFPVGPRSGF